MQDMIEQILHYLRGIARYRWQALIVSWVICLAGWGGISQLADQYQASTKFEVDTSSVLAPLLGGAIAEPEEKLRLLQHEVLSNTNIEKIIRKVDLDLTVQTDAELEVLIKDVKNKISFKKQRRNNIFTISYIDNDPRLAWRIVQELLNLFQEKALGDKRRDSDQAERFLDDQIERYRTQLQDVESRLADFKQANIDRLPEQGKDYYQRLQEAKSKVREATLELRQAENELSSLLEQMRKEQKLMNGAAADADNVSIPEIDDRIAKLNALLDDLLLRYTDRHPDVMNTRRLIESLQQQKATIIENLSKDSKAKENLSNPVYQQLRIAIGEVEARIASLRVKVAEYQTREQELEELLHELPEVEERLKDLTREYSIIKQHHDDMVAKRETARIQKEKEQSSNDLKFKLHDAPKTPLEPVGPNRLLFHSLLLIAGCGIGLGVALLLSQVNNTFYDSKSLNSAIALPVIGTVSMVMTNSERRTRIIQRLLFIFAFMMLLTVFFMLIAIEILGIRLF